MGEIINYLLLIIIVIFHIKSEENNSNIISLKFKTYYPCSNNSLYNPNTFTTDDYAQNIHLSKIYFEVGVGDENNFKSKTNQSLNIIVDLKETIFQTTSIYFEKYISENNDILCHYNTSESSTFTGGKKYYKINEDIKSLCCYAKEFFQIYTDISLKKYEIKQLNFVNTIDHNISNICGNIGLGYTHPESKAFHFLAQLYSNFELSEYSFTFNYSNNNSDEGIFTFGNMPHIYLPKKYKYENLIPIYSLNNKEPLIDCNELLIEREGYKIDLKDMTYKIKIIPDIEGFEFPLYFFGDLEDIFFEKYLQKKICHKEVYDRTYRVIYCDKGENKFEEKNIKSFPNITFYLGRIPDNFTANFIGEDLFYYKNNKNFFKIIEDTLGSNIILGRIFFKKYLTVFNQDKKQIYFYNNINNKNDEEKNNNKDKDKDDNKKNDSKKTVAIIIISFIISLLIFFPLGIIFGKKIFRQRNKKAYELNDGYDYKTAEDKTENFDIN